MTDPKDQVFARLALALKEAGLDPGALLEALEAFSEWVTDQSGSMPSPDILPPEWLMWQDARQAPDSFKALLSKMQEEGVF